MTTDAPREQQLEQVCLASAVQGVELRVRLQGRPVRAIIAGSVFETRFAADDPRTWVATYYHHQALIDRAILRKAFDAPMAPVIVLLERDFPRGAS